MNDQLKLALIREIPESEKTDLYNAMGGNEEFIDREYALKEEKGKK
jgi:hypothetical protein